ncbi:MAG: AraC family transcriptional regulator, partial [Candidatus Omnitrophota bacterium]
FKEYTKEGFNGYRLRFKIEEAKNLLIKTGYTVEQISEKLGYENPESFIRQFKKITKKTPSVFRRKQKDNKRIKGR